MTKLRWFAVAGQASVVMFVRFGLGFDVALAPLVAVIAAGVGINLYLVFTEVPSKPLSGDELVGQILADLLQIGAVLFLTGGIQNPFAVWLVLPAMLAASALDRRRAMFVVAAVVVTLTILAVAHLPLPWSTPEGYEFGRLYSFGLWIALVLGVLFTAGFAFNVANEQSKLRAALDSTQHVLAREEKLNALGGLATAAAHELGTPLSTIQVTAREMERELDDEDLREDARLLISQTQRCQSILTRLAKAADDDHHHILSLEEILREAARPFLENQSKEIEFAFDPYSSSKPPERLVRRAEVIYGLRTIIENAVKFADARVRISAAWDDSLLAVVVEDDGKGFSESAQQRLGEPFSRSREEIHAADGKKGLGLGFFISQTLLERTGARICHGNDKTLGGAWVEVTWPLSNLLAAKPSHGSSVLNQVEKPA